MSGGKLQSKHAAGIWFWFKWIVTAIASFVASLFFWNWLLFQKMGGNMQSRQHAIGWMVAVFGTWFILLTLLMRKKERVMGHMDAEDESTVSWWLIWIGLTIGSFFLAVWFWTPFVAKHFGSIQNSQTSIVWVVAVFGTWIVGLVPLLIFMYQKVDRAYEKARERRERLQIPEKDPVKIKAVLIDEAKRRLPKKLTEKLKGIPPTIRDGHLVTAILNDGRRIEHVFIAKRKELLGVYDQENLTFGVSDIADLEPTNLQHPPDFTKKTWLRLDGNAA